MTDRIMKKIETSLARRKFVKKVLDVASALALGVFAFPRQALACNHGCNLCVPNSAFAFSGCVAQWNWIVSDTSAPCKKWRCMECFDSIPVKVGQCPKNGVPPKHTGQVCCTFVKASKVVVAGNSSMGSCGSGGGNPFP